MLQCLQENSHPDIAYAVSVCFSFVHSTSRSRKITRKLIGQYLTGTLEEGLILIPPGELYVNVCFGAEFSALWPYEDNKYPTSVKSHTVF